MIHPFVDSMIENQGLYIATLPGVPGDTPVVSINGKLYAIRLDQELSREGFHPQARFAGPFRGDHS